MENSLTEQIKSQLTNAMKSQQLIRKNILRVVMGEMSTLEGRTGKKPSDADVVKIVKKLIQSNQETQKYLDVGSDKHSVLAEENTILESLLPKTLTVDEIIQILSTFEAATKSKEGPAIGMSVKYLASHGYAAAGEDVATAVRKMRESLAVDFLPIG